MRRMEIEGEVLREGQGTPVTMEMVPSDYRTVDGLVHPFLTQMTMSGLKGAVSEEEMEQARQALAEMKKQMAEMPADQREMMNSMMGSQMDRLEDVVNSGEMKVTVQVKEVRVNEGDPADCAGDR
jgi:hypothetical protein